VAQRKLQLRASSPDTSKHLHELPVADLENIICSPKVLHQLATRSSTLAKAWPELCSPGQKQFALPSVLLNTAGHSIKAHGAPARPFPRINNPRLQQKKKKKIIKTKQQLRNEWFKKQPK